MNVLSLCDGMSCGHIALKELGITVDSYYASEIDKNSIKVTQDNFPDTKQLGDVTKLNPEDLAKSLPKIDLVMFGPDVIDHWTLDWAKDDIIDFCFFICGIKDQNPLFSLHLLLSFDPEDDSWNVYTQYTDDRDDHIYVNAGDISPNPVDNFADLRDYLEHVVELGNRLYDEYQKRLTHEE